MKKKLLYSFAAGLMSLVILGGCAGTSDYGSRTGKEETGNENTVIIADTQGPGSLDPAQSWDSWYTSRWGITETLYKLDENLDPCPFLAKNCEMLDDTTWVITLREDVTFQNGKKMTAESVKECWERTAGINARFNEILYIDSMKADGQTLTVKTSKPVPAFLNSLCEPLTGVIDVSAEQDPAVQPVGTGPFRAVSFESNARCAVEKYENYWGGEPKADGAVINIIGDTTTLAMAQQNGETDISVSMPGTSLELFGDTSRYNVDGVAGSRGEIIYFNYDNEILCQMPVRQALSMIIDKDNYAAVINKGASVPANGLYPDFMNFGSSGSERYDYDPQKAAELLDDAHITDTDGDGIREYRGEDISLRLITYNTKAELPLFCNEISSAAKEIGLDIQVEIYGSVAEQQKTGNFDMMMISATMCPTGDPQYFADITLKTGGSGNYGGYSNEDADKLIEQLDVEFDREQRVELAKEIQKEVMDDAGFIVVGHAKYYYVMGTDVKGLRTNPSEYYLLDKDVYVE